MATALQSQPPPITRGKAKPHTADLPHIREAVQAVQAGDAREITQAELEHWAETGEWPESRD